MDKEFKKLVKQVLNIVKKERVTLPKYDDDGNNNWKSLDCEIELMNDYLDDKSINWFEIDKHIDDDEMNSAIECYKWLNGEESTFGEDYLG